MVSRTRLLPLPAVRQDCASIVIWASVMAGFSEDAALRTTALASTGSLRRAMARTPSRAAADSVPCTWKACPNSAIPSTSTMSSGTIKANSTAVAPRSLRSLSRITAHLLRIGLLSSMGTDVQRRSDPDVGAAAPESRREARGRTSGQGVRDIREQALQLFTEEGDGPDDRHCDQADHEAVLDGGRALLVALQAVLGEGDQADQGGVRVQHEHSRVVSAGQTGSVDPSLRLLGPMSSSTRRGLSPTHPKE